MTRTSHIQNKNSGFFPNPIGLSSYTAALTALRMQRDQLLNPNSPLSRTYYPKQKAKVIVALSDLIHKVDLVGKTYPKDQAKLRQVLNIAELAVKEHSPQSLSLLSETAASLSRSQKCLVGIGASLLALGTAILLTSISTGLALTVASGGFLAPVYIGLMAAGGLAMIVGSLLLTATEYFKSFYEERANVERLLKDLKDAVDPEKNKPNV